jgi:hypothetical protein
MALKTTALLGGALLAAALLAPHSASAASSKGCDKDGGFSITLGDGSTIREGFRGTVAASRLNTAKLLVRGKFITFDVDPKTFAVYDYAFTGAANPLDITGGRRIVAYAGKVPDLRGSTLTSGMNVQLKDDGLEISRTGAGVSMKIQAKNCANGGLFQMEPERTDGATTRIVHTLGPDAFYYDNPNFRAREGDVVPYKDTTATVSARVNIGSDLARNFVGRDSPQVATRIAPGTCITAIPAPRRLGGVQNVDHCGGVSVWDVASGGRMGGVFGEDATEVAPAATTCTEECQAQNQVNGEAVVLGAPFPVPAANRFSPRF